MKITNQLTEILNKLNIPESRKDINKKENLLWLLRNIGIKNKQVTKIIKVNNLIKQLLKNEKSN